MVRTTSAIGASSKFRLMGAPPTAGLGLAGATTRSLPRIVRGSNASALPTEEAATPAAGTLAGDGAGLLGVVGCVPRSWLAPSRAAEKRCLRDIMKSAGQRRRRWQRGTTAGACVQWRTSEALVCYPGACHVRPRPLWLAAARVGGLGQNAQKWRHGCGRSAKPSRRRLRAGAPGGFCLGYAKSHSQPGRCRTRLPTGQCLACQGAGPRGWAVAEAAAVVEFLKIAVAPAKPETGWKRWEQVRATAAAFACN